MTSWFHSENESAAPSPSTSKHTSPRISRKDRRWSMAQMLPTDMVPSVGPALARAATVTSAAAPALKRTSMAVAAAPAFMRSNTTTSIPQTRQQFLEMQAEKLKSESDITFLLEDPEQFAKLKRELRRSGAVTNSVLKHGIHFYARSHGMSEPDV